MGIWVFFPFVLLGKIYLQNGFPIMDHLCSITWWLMDLYIPRGGQASDTAATAPLLESGAQLQLWQLWDELEQFPWLQWGLLGPVLVWSLWWWCPGGLKSHHAATGGWRAAIALKVNRHLEEWKAKMTRPPKAATSKDVSIIVDKAVTRKKKLLITLLLWSSV